MATLVSEEVTIKDEFEAFVEEDENLGPHDVIADDDYDEDDPFEDDQEDEAEVVDQKNILTPLVEPEAER